jgi:hypothetical protein
MLNEVVNKSVCRKVYGAHPFMSFSTAFSVSVDVAEGIANCADAMLLAGAKHAPEEILARALLQCGLEELNYALEGDGIENVTPFAATIADLSQTMSLMGVTPQTHKACVYVSEFEDPDLSEEVLMTIMFIVKDAEDILLK